MSVATLTVHSSYQQTGVPESYEANGVVFLWHDWVLCEIEWHAGNPRHWCIASSFRGMGPKDMTCTILNPSYEEMKDFVPLRSLHHFRPVQVLGMVRTPPARTPFAGVQEA